MKLIYLGNVLLLIGATLCTPLHAETPVGSETTPSLNPIAFLTKHEWDAKLPDPPDGKKMKIHAQFTWSQNRQAIRISNQFVVDGKARPYIDGLYAWDPQQHMIVFWYVDAGGSLTKGTVKVEGGQLVHEFEEIAPRRKVIRLRRQGNTKRRAGLGERDLRAARNRTHANGQGALRDSGVARLMSTFWNAFDFPQNSAGNRCLSRENLLKLAALTIFPNPVPGKAFAVHRNVNTGRQHLHK